MVAIMAASMATSCAGSGNAAVTTTKKSTRKTTVPKTTIPRKTVAKTTVPKKAATTAPTTAPRKTTAAPTTLASPTTAPLPAPTVVAIVPSTQLANARAAAPWADYATVKFTVTQADGTTKEFCALLADTPSAQARGLMQRTDLGGYDAMLFTWPSDTSGGFWMRTVPIWLSIAWFNAVGKVVTQLDMAPCGDRDDCPTYSPAGPYRVAMETLRGGLEPLGVSATSRLQVGGACLLLPKPA